MKSKLKRGSFFHLPFSKRSECMAINSRSFRKLYRNKSEAEKIIKDPFFDDLNVYINRMTKLLSKNNK